MPHAQIHHGTDDELPATHFSNTGLIETVLKGEKTSVTTFPYAGATHGFAGKDSANVSAAALSKTTTLAFFSAHLSGARAPTGVILPPAGTPDQSQLPVTPAC